MREQYRLYIVDKDTASKINFKGLLITIENPEGDIRSGVDEDGQEWKTIFQYPYGFIDNTKGADGEEVDCFVGDNYLSDMVYIVHQLKEDGRYDEDKCFLGFDSLKAARDAYLAHYNTQGFIGKITEMPFFEFAEKINQEGIKGVSLR